MLEIDGSFGEGGGQILRTSLALSLITRTPFRIVHIRRNRAKPGLRRQHLTAVRAAARIGNAEVEGDAVHSTELTFRPREASGGDYEFDIGTGGSSTLVFQTVLPALLLAPHTSCLRFRGGTHNHGGPPWDFISSVFLPAIERIGARVTTTLQRHGFAQGGEGVWTADIQPSTLEPLRIQTRGEVRSRSVRALVSNLPISIAERELATIRESLRWQKSAFRAEQVDATGPGNVVMIAADFAYASEMATGFGERGLRAEIVARRAVECWLAYERSGVAIGEHLADQLLLPMALAGGGSFTTMAPTLHTRTNIDTIGKFLSVRFRTERVSEECWVLSV